MSQYPVIPIDKQVSQQAIFDAVVGHLMRQGDRCITENGMCAYRDDSGMRACAIGALLTDDEAAAMKKGLIGNVMHMRNAGLMPKRFEPFTFFLSRLQVVHDVECGSYQQGWQRQLLQVAKEFNLTPPDVIRS